MYNGIFFSDLDDTKQAKQSTDKIFANCTLEQYTIKITRLVCDILQFSKGSRHKSYNLLHRQMLDLFIFVRLSNAENYFFQLCDNAAHVSVKDEIHFKPSLPGIFSINHCSSKE